MVCGHAVAPPARRSPAAARVVRRQRRVPLPRAGVRGAAVRARRAARAPPGCGSRPRRVVLFAWRRPWRLLREPLLIALGARARGDELLLLPRDRPAAARHGRRDRVPAGHRAGRARRAHAAQRGSRSRWPSPASTCSPACGSRASRSASSSRSRTRASSRSTSCSATGSRRARASTGSRRRWSPRSWSSRRSRAGTRVPALGDPVAIARRHRRRGRLVGHPLRLRPDGDGAALARRLRAAGLAAAGDRDGDRHRRARPAALGAGDRAASRWSSSASPSTASRDATTRTPPGRARPRACCVGVVERHRRRPRPRSGGVLRSCRSPRGLERAASWASRSVRRRRAARRGRRPGRGRPPGRRARRRAGRRRRSRAARGARRRASRAPAPRRRRPPRPPPRRGAAPARRRPRTGARPPARPSVDAGGGDDGRRVGGGERELAQPRGERVAPARRAPRRRAPRRSARASGGVSDRQRAADPVRVDGRTPAAAPRRARGAPARPARRAAARAPAGAAPRPAARRSPSRARPSATRAGGELGRVRLDGEPQPRGVAREPEQPRRDRRGTTRRGARAASRRRRSSSRPGRAAQLAVRQSQRERVDREVAPREVLGQRRAERDVGQRARPLVGLAPRASRGRAARPSARTVAVPKRSCATTSPPSRSAARRATATASPSTTRSSSRGGRSSSASRTAPPTAQTPRLAVERRQRGREHLGHAVEDGAEARR